MWFGCTTCHRFFVIYDHFWKWMSIFWSKSAAIGESGASPPTTWFSPLLWLDNSFADDVNDSLPIVNNIRLARGHVLGIQKLTANYPFRGHMSKKKIFQISCIFSIDIHECSYSKVLLLERVWYLPTEICRLILQHRVVHFCVEQEKKKMAARGASSPPFATGQVRLFLLYTFLKMKLPSIILLRPAVHLGSFICSHTTCML